MGSELALIISHLKGRECKRKQERRDERYGTQGRGNYCQDYLEINHAYRFKSRGDGGKQATASQGFMCQALHQFPELTLLIFTAHVWKTDR